MHDGTPDSSGDWGPFGRPIFNDPAARALSRVGVIDVGSNSVRMVIFDGAARSPAYFYNEKVMAGLGAGMDRTGRLNPKGRQRALDAIRRFTAVAAALNVPPLTAVATAAVRVAEDGEEFRQQVEAETGQVVHVIDGEEEARLSAQGVLLGWPTGEGLVCDIGGSSMELARIEGGLVRERATSALGPLRLMTMKGGKKSRTREIKSTIAELDDRIERHDRLYLVGGSWRAIARLDMVRKDYPLSVLHDYRMTPKSIRATLDWIDGQDLEQLRQRASLSSARISLVPIAGEVLRRLMSTFRVSEIITSGYGIREGLLYEQMPHRIRSRDPLLEAASHSEHTSARLPGYGRTLHGFIQPLFRGSRTDPRWIKAACLLHDVSWRAHPDYRAEICFDNATRGNLGGIDHPGRIFLGLALAHRYRNARPGGRFDALLTLLNEKQIREAEVLGKAMRFGAMLTVVDATRMGELRYRPKKRILELHLPQESEALFGEVAAARFVTLARALEVETEVKIQKKAARKPPAKASG
ncbi:exopolyphosphatase/guanosine-5'-triphosphate,3'-diphosphate pyrophosphatase [Aliiruegeria haliotis]|uniref:Exopolyphosphatase/guanosine-5'-triphosphate, 3'-diphosphate pyrophosphatase n=1 Tax=Aliiruegeria haliotis TaxID=1280846 RepID=A0A2T0RVG2_9RHOB|nr:Ppx/GppA family phosphatase [Aliiruegeria haliotis]PRY25043.1 exopolyphosphatase/guanosine-5'-triphosphate,3'-diphosphate pyrophosphatase [Aliiruegeria haliotis]